MPAQAAEPPEPAGMVEVLPDGPSHVIHPDMETILMDFRTPFLENTPGGRPG